ncbi:class I SAM-dependent methyltransferase [Microlunatus soli]|uniref:Methyltransferase domain-containing protein n=1 Tax=Microlunatus soli TaxID=630515 RepID=A0A1H1WIH8_9ACTN|nr:class I SAM-dependent methyltransferase [Microlunatus soli]SDS96411.1 Methyltransferase domain-containing protein [Microlunatus soli]
MDRRDEEVRRGAAIYSRAVLAIYDLWVVRFSNTLVWRCPRRVISELYDGSIGRRHLDVGPGTGWYLAHAELPADGTVTLMDLNPNSLEHASARLAPPEPRHLIADVLQELPESAGPFDSIGANYLLHCLPGPWSDKGAAVEHLAARLTPDGVLFGSTILGRGVDHNLLGRRLMDLYNDRGIFHNTDDNVAGLRAVLDQHFAEVMIDIVGTVAVFRARRPR